MRIGLQPKLYESCDQRGLLRADLKPDEKKMNPHSARWNVDQSHQEGNWVGGGCQKSLQVYNMLIASIKST